MTSGPESPVLRACRDWLKLHGCLVRRQNVARGWFVPYQKGMSRPHPTARWMEFGEVGDHDLYFCNPYGRYGCVETKSDRNTLSPEQVAFKNEVEQRGGVVIAPARSIDDLEARRGEILARPTWS